MPVAIKKCEFFTRKTNFVRFIIKLGENQYRPKEGRSYSQLARTRECYAVKIIPRVL